MNAFWSHVIPVAYLFIGLAQLFVFLKFMKRRYDLAQIEKANYQLQRKFVHDMATNHLPHIYAALKQIAHKGGLELEEPPPYQWVELKLDTNGNGKNGH